MNIKFKITHVAPNDNLIVVRYYTDLLTEESLGGRTDFSINLPIPAPATQAELAQFILSRAPSAFLAERENLVTAPLNLDHISALIGDEIDPAKVLASQVTPATILADAQANQIKIITTSYLQAIQTPVVYNGNTFQADMMSYVSLTTAITGGGATYWLDTNNVKVPTTLADMQAISKVINDQRQAGFDKLQTLKQNVRNATTPEAVALITW